MMITTSEVSGESLMNGELDSDVYFLDRACHDVFA